ncbi:MAG TPA: hypothetical protein VLC47_02105 [Burkholderiales bacterium]|nr:hypothetical protein [Burkholderiales bacterium]
MKTRRSALALLVAAALSGGAHTVAADEAAALTGEIQTMDASATTKGSGAVTGKIATDFQSFAGSQRNATNLVTGLRSGSTITLTERHHRPATFTPPTRPMGYGNVSTSLALARFQLAQQGINHPTPQQLETALMGGTITANGRTVAYRGILQMRADGMGWGEIAHASGTKLGLVVRSIKSQNTHFVTTHPATGHHHPGMTTTTHPVTGHHHSEITTASGVPSGSHPDVRASGARDPAGTRGIVTAAGAAPSASHGHGKGAGQVSTAGGVSAAPRGQGIVTAAGYGASPYGSAASSRAHGDAGVVNASGTGATSSSAHAQAGGRGNAAGHAK